MSTVLETVPDSSVMPPYPVRRWTVAEYRHLAEIGVLSEDDHVELLEGWIVPKMTKDPPHEWTVTRIDKLLQKSLGDAWVVRTQCAINTEDSEPEPDHSIVRGPEERYLKHHPRGDDIALVIEVADTSLNKDRNKAAMYAAEGIPTYWIVNLVDEQIECHTSPDTRSRSYESRTVHRSGEQLEFLLDEHTSICLSLDQIFPPSD